MSSNVMNRQQQLISIGIFIAILLAIVLLAPLSSRAAGLQSRETVEPSATLINPQTAAPIAIPIYLRPAPNQPNVGYGMTGDSVTVLEQLASFLPEADESTAWNHIRLDHEPYTEGWLQGKFLSTVKADSQTPQ